MTISKRDLEAAGLPLGDSVTRAKPGGGYVCGFGGDSSSSSRSDTYNYNYDNRVAVQDGIGLANSSGNVINVTDSGLVSRALDSVDLSNATNAEGFSQLLTAAESLWSRGESLIGQTQAAVADAYSQAKTDTAGTIDNKTMIVLAIVASVAIVATKGKL